MRRPLLLIGGLLLACLVLFAVALWYADAVWLPTRGKALLTRRLGQALHADVTLQDIGLHPWRGLILTDLRLTETATHRRIHIASARVLIAPWALWRRSVAFRAHVQLAEPAAVAVTLAGTYGWADRRLAMDVESRPFSLTAVGAPLRERFPPALRAATTAWHLHVAHDPAQGFTVTGRINGTDLLVEHAPYRAQGDLRIEGAARQPAALPDGTPPAWHWDVTATPSRMTLAGLPHGLPTLDNLTGAVQCSDFAVTALNLTGRLGQATVGLTGTVDDVRRPQAQWTVILNTPIAFLRTLVPRWPQTLQLEGTLHLTADLRGTGLDEPPALLRADADVRDLGVQPAPPWPTVRHGAGHLHFAAGTLTLTDVRLDVNGVPCTLTGGVQHLDPSDEPEIALQLASDAGAARLDAQWEERALHLRALEGRFHHSTFRVLGDLLNLPHPVANVYVESALTLADLASLPLPAALRDAFTAHHIDGAATLTASYQGPLDAQWMTGRLGLKFSTPQCVIDQITLEQMAADVRVEDGRLTIPAWQAQYAGGAAVLQLAADLRQPVPPFRAQVDVTHVDLSQATRSWRTDAARPVAGLLSTSWIIEGAGSHRTTWRGSGTVQAAGENLSTVPVFDRVLGGLGGVVADYLRLGQLRQVTFKQADGHFTIAEGRAITHDLMFRGDTMGVALDGAIGLEGGLDLIASPSIALAVLQQSPVGGQALEQPARQLDLLALGRVRISGTLQQPEFKSQLVPLHELLQGAISDRVQDVLHGLGDILRR